MSPSSSLYSCSILIVSFSAEPVAIPTLNDLLAPDQTVISPLYMMQLLQYGIKLGQAGRSPDGLEEESAVSFPVFGDDLALTSIPQRLVQELRKIHEE